MNKLGREFTELYEKYKEYPFFTEVELDFGSVLEFNAPADIYNNCYKIAREKSKYTMSYAQNLIIRKPKEKVIKQFKGILAETAIQFYLIQKCRIPFDKVHRWDLERDTFRYAAGEYDLKITTKREEMFIESRSSDSYKTSLDEFISRYDIIGKYSNSVKMNEKKADLYLRPVYQFVPCIKEEERGAILYNTYKMIGSKQLRLYLVSGATKEEMYGKKSYMKSMSQNKTTYRCLRITDAGDMNRISEIICRKFIQLGGCLDGTED